MSDFVCYQMNKNLNGNVWNKASPRQTWTKYFIFILSNLIKFHQPQMTAYLMSQHDYCHERGGDIKHKYLKKSSTQFFTQWVKIAKCVFKQIPERVEYFVTTHDSITVTFLSSGLKLEWTLVLLFAPQQAGQCQWSGERGEREGNKRSAQKVGSCLMCSGWPLSDFQKECSTKKDWVGHLMRRKFQIYRG